MAGFSLTDEARADIASIALYTRQRWGSRQGAKYLQGLQRRIVGLVRKPALGRPRPELGDEVRSALYRAHVVIYRVSDELVGLRVAHQAEDVR